MMATPMRRTNGRRKVNLKEVFTERYSVLQYMKNCLSVLVGQMGTGKTTSAIYLAHWMRDLFDLPVIQIGTNMGLTPEFGPFEFMSKEGFIKQLILMSEIAGEVAEKGLVREEAEAYVMDAKKTRGLKLYKAILLVDEFQNYCDARHPHSRINKATYGFVDMMRHYHCTMIGMVPAARKIDINLREQVRWICKPDFDPQTKWYTLRFRGPQGKLNVKLYAPDAWKMYDSWAFTAMDNKFLEKVLEKDV